MKKKKRKITKDSNKYRGELARLQKRFEGHYLASAEFAEILVGAAAIAAETKGKHVIVFGRARLLEAVAREPDAIVVSCKVRDRDELVYLLGRVAKIRGGYEYFGELDSVLEEEAAPIH